MTLTRNVSPEKMSTNDLKSVTPLSHAAGMRALHDLCINVLISETERSDFVTSIPVVHRRNVPDEGFNRKKAANGLMVWAHRAYEKAFVPRRS